MAYGEDQLYVWEKKREGRILKFDLEMEIVLMK